MKTFSSKIFLLGFFLILFGVTPFVAGAFTDEGPVLWASGGNVMQRYHSEARGTLGAPSVAIAGVDAKFIIVRADPLVKEFILGVQDTAGTLSVYHSADGVSWTADWNVSLGDGNVPRFDIAYEQSTGRAMVAYRGRISGGKTTFYYRIWNGSTWTVQTERNGGPTAGNIVALKLAARNGSAQLALAYLDDTRSGGAATWSGSAWTFWGTKITTNGTFYTGFAGVYPPVRALDIAFESVAGDLLVVMGENSTNKARYATRTAAGAWSAVGSITTLNGYGDFVQLTPSPTTNEIALSTCTLEPSVSQYLCEFVMWGGSAFGTPVADSVVAPISDGGIPTDTIWLVDGANRAAVSVYGNEVTNGLDWYQSTNGGNFVAGTTDTTAPSVISNEGQVHAVQISGFPSQAIMLIDDASNAGYMKRATLSGTTVTWSSVAPGTVPELTTWTYPVPSSAFARMGMALQVAPPLFVMSTTSASTVSTVPSAGTAYIADTTCTSSADCTGLTMTARGKNAITVSRIMLTNTGTVNLAQTSNWMLDIDTDANPNNGITRSVAGVVSGNTITFTFSPTLSMNPGQRLYAFPKATFGNGGVYPSAGQTINLAVNTVNDFDTTSAVANDELLIGTPTIKAIIAPNMTGYTNTSEPALNFSAGCTNCGGRLGAGSFAQTITINGFGFGADPGAANRATAMNQIVIQGATPTTIKSANVTSWSNTQIVISLNTAVTGNADADFGTNYGGATALSVTTAGITGDGLNFYLFPQVTGLLVPTGLGPDGAKEYNAADTDGVITLLGTRFGASQNTSAVQILGCSATTCTSPTNSVVVESWSNTAIKVDVPTIIANNVYTGAITFVRDFPTASAAKVDYANIFSIRPRLASITPTSGGQGDAITLTGDHLCPVGGVCPTGTLGTDSSVLLTPGFSSSDNLVLGGATADYWNSWSHTQVVTAVPVGATLGATLATLTAGTYPAGAVAFTVVNNNVASPPASLVQYATTTQNTSMISGSGLSAPTMTTLGVGSSTAATTVFMGGVITSASGVPGSMRLAVEVQPIGTAFICTTGACGTVKLSAPVAGPGTVDCSVLTNNCRVSIPLTENTYHWRARTEYTVNSITYYSAWTVYPTPTPNLETAADFLIDQTAPTSINISSGTPSTNSVTLSWNTSEPATQVLQLNKTGIFTSTCASGNGCSNESLTLSLNHTATLSNLDSNTLYYYRIYAADAAGNFSWSSVQQFTTLGVTQPAKTLYFHVLSSGTSTTAGSAATSTFTVVIPETGVQFQSIFLDLRGLYQTSGSASNATLGVQVNGGSTATYALPGGRALFAPWRLYHPLVSLNLSPGANTLTVTAGNDTTLSSIGADVVLTYSYTP
jgi:hypothetical protein